MPVTNAALAVQLLLGLLAQSQNIGQLLAAAQTAGVDLTDAQLDELTAAYNVAVAKLTADITAARAAPPAA